MSCCFGANKKRAKGEQRTSQSNEHFNGEQKATFKQSRTRGISSKTKNVDSTKVRKSDYEVQQMRKSKLLQKTQIMDFKLDDPDGISHTPYINTFRYESILSHNFLSIPRKPNRQQKQ